MSEAPENSDESDTDVLLGGIFGNNDYEEPVIKGHLVKFYTMLGMPIDIHLIGKSPLYGHILTNACKYIAKYLERNMDTLVKDRTVIEFGSGGALPSILCAKLGASMALATDYPDPELVNNIEYNIKMNKVQNNCKSLGFIWGNDISDILSLISGPPVERKTFDTIILSDVIFNHTEHYKLLKTCKQLITPKTGRVLVAFTPHRPHLLDADLSFFQKAQEQPYNFKLDFIEMVHYSPLFKDDKDESTREIRSRVYMYILYT